MNYAKRNVLNLTFPFLPHTCYQPWHETYPGKGSCQGCPQASENQAVRFQGQSKGSCEKKAATKGAHATRQRKVRTSVHFRRPKTLRLQHDPKYSRKSTPNRCRMDQYAIVKYPLTTESTMKKIEDNNTLVFIVHKLANKPQIKLAVMKLYDIDASKVNTLNRPDGEKKLGLCTTGPRL